MDLNNTLKRQAIGLGLCSEWTEEWRDNEDRQSLIDKYLEGIDFVIEHDWPSVDFIKENFESELLTKNGIYVDGFMSMNSHSGTLVFLGDSKAKLSFKNFDCCRIYARHDSEININVSGFSKIFIHAYDNAKIHIVSDNQAKVYIYLHGDNCNLSPTGSVMVRK